MEDNPHARNLIILSAVMAILAGIIHLVLIPIHREHAPAHGLFFLLVGVAQIIWGIRVWRQPTLKLYYIGAAMAGWLIVLYALTRVLPAPFTHGPERIETVDLVCKFCEGVTLASLILLMIQGSVFRANWFHVWRTISLILLVSVLAGFSTYSLARAAEPILPWLATPLEKHHHDENAPSEEHHHDESFLTSLL